MFEQLAFRKVKGKFFIDLLWPVGLSEKNQGIGVFRRHGSFDNSILCSISSRKCSPFQGFRDVPYIKGSVVILGSVNEDF